MSLQANRYFGLTPPADSTIKQEVNGWSVGLQLSIPIFDGFSTQHATQSANARSTSALQDERNARLDEELKFVSDFETMESTDKKLILLRQAEKTAQQAFEASQVRYNEGVGTIIELLSAQGELAKIHQDMIEAHFDLLAVKFRIPVALDGFKQHPSLSTVADNSKGSN